MDTPAFQRIKTPTGETAPPADPATQREIAYLELQKSRDEHEKLLVEIGGLNEQKRNLELQNRDLEQNISFRRFFPGVLFTLTCVWIIGVTVLIVLYARPHGYFSDAVSVALLGTTTVSVFAFFKCVTNYLFPSSQKQPEASKAVTDASEAEDQ